MIEKRWHALRAEIHRDAPTQDQRLGVIHVDPSAARELNPKRVKWCSFLEGSHNSFKVFGRHTGIVSLNCDAVHDNLLG